MFLSSFFFLLYRHGDDLTFSLLLGFLISVSSSSHACVHHCATILHCTALLIPLSSPPLTISSPTNLISNHHLISPSPPPHFSLATTSCLPRYHLISCLPRHYLISPSPPPHLTSCLPNHHLILCLPRHHYRILSLPHLISFLPRYHLISCLPRHHLISSHVSLTTTERKEMPLESVHVQNTREAGNQPGEGLPQGERHDGRSSGLGRRERSDA